MNKIGHLVPRCFAALLLSLVAAILSAQRQAPALLPPDSRLKTDLLLVIAHPDDDTLLAGYLAKLVFDEHKVVSVVYCTSGGGGGNEAGFEAGKSLAAVRTIEARRALGSIGITNVWFLNAPDTPGQNVLWSLDNWGHGRMLDEMVRLVRLTRPDVIVSWLPDYVSGENHGDHQAAGVLATEAFDSAGDPLQFPEQVTAARDPRGMNNLTEGLAPWQAQKIYYQTDAFENVNPYWHDTSRASPYRKSMLSDTGPTFSMTEVSSSRQKSYAEMFAEEQSFYATQGGALGKDAIASHNFKAFEDPVHLIFGKSLVGGAVTGGVFENVRREPVPFVATPEHRAGRENQLAIRIGGSWGFYQEFWKAHALEHLTNLIPVPEASARFGEPFFLPLKIQNGDSAEALVTLAASLPPGWTSKLSYDDYPARPGETYPVQAEFIVPKGGGRGWQEIAVRAFAKGKKIGEVTLRVYVSSSGVLPE